MLLLHTSLCILFWIIKVTSNQSVITGISATKGCSDLINVEALEAGGHLAAADSLASLVSGARDVRQLGACHLKAGLRASQASQRVVQLTGQSSLLTCSQENKLTGAVQFLISDIGGN